MNVGEQIKHSSMKNWSLKGPNRLVKVVSPSSLNYMNSQVANGTHDTLSAGGYVTQEKFLYGKTAPEIEKLLGLRPFELRQMAHIFAFERLPTANEVEFKLSTAFPDGKVFDAAGQDQMMEARDAFAAGADLYDRSMTPVMQFYQPGSNMVPQWKLIANVPISHQIATVTDVFPFQRDNGSIKPYTPHNKAAVS